MNYYNINEIKDNKLKFLLMTYKSVFEYRLYDAITFISPKWENDIKDLDDEVKTKLSEASLREKETGTELGNLIKESDKDNSNNMIIMSGKNKIHILKEELYHKFAIRAKNNDSIKEYLDEANDTITTYKYSLPKDIYRALIIYSIDGYFRYLLTGIDILNSFSLMNIGTSDDTFSSIGSGLSNLYNMINLPSPELSAIAVNALVSNVMNIKSRTHKMVYHNVFREYRQHKFSGSDAEKFSITYTSIIDNKMDVLKIIDRIDISHIIDNLEIPVMSDTSKKILDTKEPGNYKDILLNIYNKDYYIVGDDILYDKNNNKISVYDFISEINHVSRDLSERSKDSESFNISEDFLGWLLLNSDKFKMCMLYKKIRGVHYYIIRSDGNTLFLLYHLKDEYNRYDWNTLYGVELFVDKDGEEKILEVNADDNKYKLKIFDN